MKVSLLFALVGLAISFALRTHAQQTNTPNPKLRELFISTFQTLAGALNKNDAAAVAGCFTEDASLLTQYGRFSGRQAIEHWYAEVFKQVQSSNNLISIDEDSPHTLGKAGGELLGTGTWSQTIKGQNGSTEVKGSWSAIAIREGDDWKIRMLTTNVTSAPAPIALPTPSSSSQ
jgi:ketosteroid isomerase-like protein